MTLRIALVQCRTPATQAAALARTTPMIEEAARGGATLILTPEGSNFLQRKRELFTQTVRTMDEDLFVAGMKTMARDLGVTLLLGSVLVRREDSLSANRSLLIGPSGDILAHYDKIHMFDVDLPTGERHRESALYEPGDRAVVAQAAGVTLGLSVCYDLRFPGLYRELAQAGAQVLTIPSAFTRPTGHAHWEILLRARAIENGAFVLAPAQGGTHEDGRATWGRSMAIAPWGDVLAAAKEDEPGVIFADLDLTLAQSARAAIPSLANGRAFTCPSSAPEAPAV